MEYEQQISIRKYEEVSYMKQMLEFQRSTTKQYNQITDELKIKNQQKLKSTTKLHYLYYYLLI